jgi:hypothetical protein
MGGKGTGRQDRAAPGEGPALGKPDGIGRMTLVCDYSESAQAVWRLASTKGNADAIV